MWNNLVKLQLSNGVEFHCDICRHNYFLKTKKNEFICANCQETFIGQNPHQAFLKSLKKKEVTVLMRNPTALYLLVEWYREQLVSCEAHEVNSLHTRLVEIETEITRLQAQRIG